MEEVATLLNIEKRQYETGIEENIYWHQMLASSYQSRTYQEVGPNLKSKP